MPGRRRPARGRGRRTTPAPWRARGPGGAGAGGVSCAPSSPVGARVGTTGLVGGRVAVPLGVLRRAPPRVVALLRGVDVVAVAVDDAADVVERLGVLVEVGAVRVAGVAVPAAVDVLGLEAVGVEVLRRGVSAEPDAELADPPLVAQDGHEVAAVATDVDVVGAGPEIAGVVGRPRAGTPDEA